jgi:hypothetical protein
MLCITTEEENREPVHVTSKTRKKKPGRPEVSHPLAASEDRGVRSTHKDIMVLVVAPNLKRDEARKKKKPDERRFDSILFCSMRETVSCAPLCRLQGKPITPL